LRALPKNPHAGAISWAVAGICGPDRLLVVEIKANYQGWLPPDAWKWINENVGRFAA
jgi:hypothetical protein